jgi:hypothetical protein
LKIEFFFRVGFVGSTAHAALIVIQTRVESMSLIREPA